MLLEIAVLKLIEELGSRNRRGLIGDGSKEEDFLFYDLELDRLYYKYLSDWEEYDELEEFEESIEEGRLLIYSGEEPTNILQEIEDYFEEYRDWNNSGRIGNAPKKPFDYSDSSMDGEDEEYLN